MFKLRNETKIGILALFTLAFGFWGYKFLKGVNLLTTSQTFYIRYTNVDQLRPSAPVFISGLQVGMVKDIQVDKENDKTLIVILNIDRGIQIPKDTKAAIIGLTLMGGKAIDLQISSTCSGPDCAASGAYLDGYTKSLVESLLGDPDQLDAYTMKIRAAFDSIANPNDPDGLGPSVKALQESLVNISMLTAHLNRLMIANNDNIARTTSNAADITSSLKSSNGDISRALANLSDLSQQLKDAGLGETAKSATTAIDSVIVAVSSLRNTLQATEKTIGKVDLLAQNLASGQGTAGKLLTDEELYLNLVRTTRHLALLEQDLRLNPKRYNTVKLKIFGKNKTPDYASPIEDPAYQRMIDSLERAYSKRIMDKN